MAYAYIPSHHRQLCVSYNGQVCVLQNSSYWRWSLCRTSLSLRYKDPFASPLCNNCMSIIVAGGDHLCWRMWSPCRNCMNYVWQEGQEGLTKLIWYPLIPGRSIYGSLGGVVLSTDHFWGGPGFAWQASYQLQRQFTCGGTLNHSHLWRNIPPTNGKYNQKNLTFHFWVWRISLNLDSPAGVNYRH